jgi:tRNA-dihydrouridine synthase A
MGRGEDGAELASSSYASTLPPTRWDGGSTGVDSHKLSVAPMLDCTDSHFRRLVRLVSRRVHLWTEMVHQDAVIHAHETRPSLLSHGDEEHPLTVQLGGASPERLARAASICVDEYGYDEVNLNCGCPSAKVVAKPELDKRFGAALMLDADLVGECLRRMKEAVDVPVTLKHRLGVRRSYGKQSNAPDPDALDSYDFVSSFVDDVHAASGVEHFVVHARCAVLGGLSTTANRNVPPLRYDEVHRLAEDFPKLGFSLNGGVETVDEAVAHLKSGKLRGVMMGRAVYRNPAILADVDRKIYGVTDGAHRGKVAARAHPDDFSGFWRDDGFVSTATQKTPNAPSYRRRETFFALDSDRQVPCVTRLDVLRRFAVYGDAVLARKRDELEKHPKALGEARALAKAVGGVSYGVRLGASFKRNLESGLGRWTERLLSGDCAESLSFADLVDDCVEGLGAEGAEDMETPMREPLFSERRRRGEAATCDLKAVDASCAGETRESTDSGS